MAVGKKEFLSLVVLHFILLYLRSEGRSENRPCWGCVGSVMMEAALLWTLPLCREGCGDLGCGLYHSLQAFAVSHDGAAVPHSDARGQDGLNNTSGEVAEDLR